MDESEIKKLRHSFTSSSSNEISKLKKNQFGHTVLGEVKDLDTSEIHVEIAENGDIVANPSEWLLNNQKLQNMAKNVGNIDIEFEDLPEEIDAQPNLSSEAEPEKMKITPNNVNFAALLNELDEMDGTTERKQVEKHQMKNCANENCLYALPIDAKFCLKCGTAQLAKFCVECGFKFLAMEKFCPDCGNKR
jgi:RNA polymerase subunit RPABC4/transcription elongation factor Spt4